jgi:gluconokinase
MPEPTGDPAVIIVMGVSGSGKSTIASLLANRLHWEFEDGDWFHPQSNVAKMHAGHPLTDADRWPWLAAIAARIDELRATGGHAVFACSALKRAYRDVLLGGRPDVRLLYLHGTHDLIAQRLSMREGHFMPSDLLDSQFATLEEPGADENPLTVSIDGTPKEIVDTIMKKLGRG